MYWCIIYRIQQEYPSWKSSSLVTKPASPAAWASPPVCWWQSVCRLWTGRNTVRLAGTLSPGRSGGSFQCRVWSGCSSRSAGMSTRQFWPKPSSKSSGLPFPREPCVRVGFFVSGLHRVFVLCIVQKDKGAVQWDLKAFYFHIQHCGTYGTNGQILFFQNKHGGIKKESLTRHSWDMIFLALGIMNI